MEIEIQFRAVYQEVYFEKIEKVKSGVYQKLRLDDIIPDFTF